MSLAEAIRARRSIRGLHGPPLDEAEVASLVALALTAPAPHHTRPWRFVLVSQQRREALASAMAEAWRLDMERDGVSAEQQQRAIERSSGRVISAPTLLLGCLVADGLRPYPDDRRDRAEWTMAAHSFGAAMQNILLEASARGLGAYWLSAPLYAQPATRAALDLEAGWRPQALIALGHPRSDYTPFERPAPDIASALIRR